MAGILLPVTIGAAIASLQQGPVWEFEPGALKDLALQAQFDYGAGGTSVDAYVGTSFDGGVTWFDVANFHFLTAAAVKAFNLSSGTPQATILTPAAIGTITANTAQDGYLGDLLSVFYKSSGTYSGATSLAVYASTSRLRRKS